MTMRILDNGLRLIFRRTTANKIAALDCMVGAGSAYEQPDSSGITNLTQALLQKETRKRAAAELSLELESMGAALSGATHEDYAELISVCTVDDLENIMEIMADVLFNPAFSEQEIEKERRNLLDAIRLSEDSKFYYTYKHFRQLLYGKKHGYGFPVEGLPKTITSITRHDIVDHYERYYTPANMILSVVANIDEEDFLGLIDRYFPDASGEARSNGMRKAPLRRKTRRDMKQKSIEQGFLMVGYPTCTIKSRYYVPLKVISSIMGEGMSSRLFVELREKEGLAYNVGCAMPSRRMRSHFFAWIGTKPDSLETAEEMMMREIERLKTEPVGDEELERAKNYMVGRFLLSHQKNIKRAWYRGWYEMLGVGMSYDQRFPTLVSRVTPGEIMDAARRFFFKPAIQVLQPPASGE